MNAIDYIDFNKINKKDFLALLNSDEIRKHLIEHKLFTFETLTAWMNNKIQVDKTPGCLIRGVVYEGEIAGWCGIQFEEEKYELAIVIGAKYWGIGRTVFKDLMSWAKEFQHKEVYIHLLHTRPDYKFLKKIAKKTYKADFFGNHFTIYQLEVN